MRAIILAQQLVDNSNMLIYRYVPIDRHLKWMIYNLSHHVKITYFDKGVDQWYFGIPVDSIFLHAICKKNLHIEGSVMFNAIRDHFLLPQNVYTLKFLFGDGHYIAVHIAGDVCLLTTGDYGNFPTNGTYALNIIEVFELMKALYSNRPFEKTIILEN